MQNQNDARLNFFVVLAAMIAGVAGILFGFDTGVISGAILFIKGQFVLSDTQEEILMAMVLLGALVGSGVSGRFADVFGRKVSLIFTALLFLIATLVSAFSISMIMLGAARFFVGFAIGVASFVAPLYISEISPPKFRGALVSLNQLAITVGILLSYGVDSYFANAGNWRWMLGFGVFPALVLFIGVLLLPRSPRWIVLQGRINTAREILRSLRQTDDVEVELEDIQASITEKSSWRGLFKKWVWPAIFIALGLAFFQQVTGVNTVIYYAPTIFEMSGFHGSQAAIMATVGVGVANVVFTIIALPLLDLWGRRPLLLTGVLLMTVSLAFLSLNFYFAGASVLLKWAALISMITYIAGFAISLGPIMWLIIAEIFPLEVRGYGSGLMVSISWFFNGVVTVTFLTFIDLFGKAGTFLIYDVMCVLAILFVIFFIPETKGVSLEAIESNLRAGVKMRDLGLPRK